MRGIPARGRSMRMMLCAEVFACGALYAMAARGQMVGGAVAEQRLKVVRTLELSEFEQEWRDRWSGGLEVQVPFRMATDTQGRILVSDPPLGLVNVFDTREKKWWQIHGDSERQMVYPTYVAADGEDSIYVSEPFLSAVLVYRPDGRFLRRIGGAQLVLPFGIAVDRENRKLYVADHHRCQVLEYTLDGQFVRTIGSRGIQAGDLMNPSEVVLHGGKLIVLDGGNARLQSFDLEGNAKGILPFGDNWLPIGYAFDRKENLYGIDAESGGMVALDAAGNSEGTLDVQVPYGQPREANMPLSFVSVWEDVDGTVLALKPGLRAQVITVETGTSVQAAVVERGRVGVGR